MLLFDRSEKAAEIRRALAAEKREAVKAEKAAQRALTKKPSKKQQAKANAEAAASLGIPVDGNGELPTEVTEAVTDRTTAQVSDELADIRKKWVDITPGQRSGMTGDKLSKRYRRLALEFQHLTGEKPPAIYADM